MAALNYGVTQSEFDRKLSSMDWRWVENIDALEHYFQLLKLLNQHPVQLVPDVRADGVLHKHLKRDSFDQDMHVLFGQKLIHEVGATENSALSSQLYKESFGTIAEWQGADCGVLLTN